MPLKVTRDRRLFQLNDLLTKNPSDILLKNSVNRTKQANLFQDNTEYLQKLWENTTPTAETMKTADVASIPKEGLNFTAGDWIGTVGSIVGSMSEMANTIQNAKSTKPVVNHYKGVNETAIAANQKYKDQIGYNKAATEAEINRNLDIAANTARARLRGSASGINTLRSLDLATDLTTNNSKVSSKNQLEATFGQQMSQALGLDVNLLSEQAKLDAQGQTAADEANAANLDSFYTNFAQNIAGATQTVQQLGANFNKAKQRDDFMKLLPQSNKWGIGLDKNMNAYSTIPTTPVTKSKYTPSVKTITENPITGENTLSDDYLQFILDI